MEKIAAPPQPKNVWEYLETLDYETLGHLLACHLIIEHYMDRFITLQAIELNWDAARLTFSQKVALLSKLEFKPNALSVAAIKHLNSLRNRFSHNIDAELSEDDLGPLTQFLNEPRRSIAATVPATTDPIHILKDFTKRTCAFFEGAIFAHTHEKEIRVYLKETGRTDFNTE